MNNTELIYHHSYMKIEYPEIRKHRFTKDFSWGFYCTKIKEKKKKWASKFNTSIVNVYEVKNISFEATLVDENGNIIEKTPVCYIDIGYDDGFKIFISGIFVFC